MSRQVFVSPERMVVQKLEKYPAAIQDSNFDHSRFQEIEAEFKALDIDQSGWLSLQEIEQHLKRKGCDQTLVEEIFNDLNTNQDTKISKDEFTHGYLTKEYNLKNDVKQLELKIKELRIHSQQISQQVNETNMQQLIIKLQSGCLSQHYRSQDDITKASKQIEVHFECDQSTDGHERTSKPSLNCEFPVWGETFNYSLNQVQQINMKLKLFELNKLEKEPLGMNAIQLSLQFDFERQEKIIIDDIGDILLQIQYVSDWNLYLQTQLQVNENQINQLLEMVKQQKKKLYFMKQLYIMDNQFQSKKQKENVQLSNLSLAKYENQFVKSSIVHSDQKGQYETQPVINNQQQINFEAQQNNQQQNELAPLPIQHIQRDHGIRQATSVYKNYKPQIELQDAFNIFKHSIDEPEDIIVNLDSINNQEKFKILCILLGLITINITFGHGDFVGLVLVLLSLPYQNKKWNDQQVKFYTYGIGFSLVLDFYWIIKYTSCFSNLEQCNNEFGFAVIIYFLCILTFIAKMYTVYKIHSYQ